MNVSVFGSVYILVRVSELLQGQASGSAEIEYSGNPTVDVTVSGTAVVRPHQASPHSDPVTQTKLAAELCPIRGGHYHSNILQYHFIIPFDSDPINLYARVSTEGDDGNSMS